MKSLHDLIDEQDPAITLLMSWVQTAVIPCEILPPSQEREQTLLDVQVTTHSVLGALAYDTGGLLLDGGWLRFLGSGHPRIPRTISAWNSGRSSGYYLVADDAAGGFFAINGGAMGTDRGSMYYWAPDGLEWEPLGLGLADMVHTFMSDRFHQFYEGLKWTNWQRDVADLAGDRCFNFYPFLWTKEGSPDGSSRRSVPVSEAFDAKVSIVRQLSEKSTPSQIQVRVTPEAGNKETP